MHQNGKSKTDGFQFLMILFLCDVNHFFIEATVGELPVLRVKPAMPAAAIVSAASELGSETTLMIQVEHRAPEDDEMAPLVVDGSVALVELQFDCTGLDVGVDGPSR
jgi:hypothetical protein